MLISFFFCAARACGVILRVCLCEWFDIACLVFDVILELKLNGFRDLSGILMNMFACVV